MRAEILLDRDGNAVEEAEALFGQSLEIARRQEAKTFELRAATSLARLWQRQGKRDAAATRLRVFNSPPPPLSQKYSRTGFRGASLGILSARAELERP